MIAIVLLLCINYAEVSILQREEVTQLSTSENFVKLKYKPSSNQHHLMRLQDYQTYFDISLSEFIQQHSIPDSEIHEDVAYEKLTDVTRIDLPAGEFLFFKEGKLVMIYISEEKIAKELWDEFSKENNTPEKRVRSRAGKTANQLIFASRGLTASIAKDEVHFIEIYPPCTLETYLEQIYNEPSPFIR